jgi:hypothetical protein
LVFSSSQGERCESEQKFGESWVVLRLLGIVLGSWLGMRRFSMGR